MLCLAALLALMIFLVTVHHRGAFRKPERFGGGSTQKSEQFNGDAVTPQSVPAAAEAAKSGGVGLRFAAGGSDASSGPELSPHYLRDRGAYDRRPTAAGPPDFSQLSLG